MTVLAAAGDAAADLAVVAFGATPQVPVRLARTVPAQERWLAAVALGGQGRYGAAATLLSGLLADPRVPAGTAAHAAVTLASHRRQLGGHAIARGTDALGLALATAALRGPGSSPEPDALGTDPLAARIDALVGLAADAVGTAAPDVAQRLLDRAAPEAAGHGSWRLAVRIGWVRAELALVRGRPGDAVSPAETALERSRAAGAVRHRVKSAIVHTVACAAAGTITADDALTRLDAATADCVQFGLLPLLWPCHYAAADLIERMSSDRGRTANESMTRTAQRSVGDTINDAARRRHAAAVTMSALYQFGDPVGRRLLGDSVRPT